LAASQINAKGGVLGQKIALDVQDAACDPQAAVNAASKLVSQKVTGVVGGYCSGATLPTLKIFGDAGTPFVIAAANSTKLIGANAGNAFMINSTGYDQAKTAVALFKGKGVKSLAVVDEGDAYSADLSSLTSKAWTEAGGKVTAHEVVNKGEQDFSALVTRIKSARPDAVFWTAYYADGGLLIKQLRQAGYTGLIALGDGNNSPKLFQLAGNAINGVYCFSDPTADILPNAKAFTAAYRKRFNQAPGPYSTLSYDGLNLLANAIKTAGSTSAPKIVAVLKATKNFPGVAGPISFTPQNTLARSNFVTLVARGGHWALYKPGA
jgi:branched-chain amino acid transport system substrate-binding protein